MDLVVIVAVDRNLAIGRNNTLPWSLPDDLARFKALTLGNIVCMGRNTACSLGRALPGRTNLVLTRQATAPFAGMLVCSTLHRALEYAGQANQDALWVIGGGQVYADALPVASRLHVTHVDTAISQPDTFFPDIDPDVWEPVAVSAHQQDARHRYSFRYVDYYRRARQIAR